MTMEFMKLTLALTGLFLAIPAIGAQEPTPERNVKLTMGPEHVIVRGIRPEEKFWGPYQFPRPYNLGDRLVVSVHVSDDNISSFGNPCRWFESRDKGATWNEIDPRADAECGLLLPDGDRLYFPPENGIDVSGYTMTPIEQYTPGYDFTRQAPEGTLPVPDGITYWMWGTEIRAYDADRLPEPLCRKEWTALRIKAGEKEPVKEMVRWSGPG